MQVPLKGKKHLKHWYVYKCKFSLNRMCVLFVLLKCHLRNILTEDVHSVHEQQKTYPIFIISPV